jgi:hypothetical protein
MAQELRFEGRHRGEWLGVAPTGKRVENPVCSVVEVGDDGLSVRETAYWDALNFFAQVGATATAATPATACRPDGAPRAPRPSDRCAPPAAVAHRIRMVCGWVVCGHSKHAHVWSLAQQPQLQ